MFISKAEKRNLYQVIAELKIQLRENHRLHAEDILSLSSEIENLKSSVTQLQVKNMFSSVRKSSNNISDQEIEDIKHEKKKASMREYYHRKKAERLEREAKEKAAQARATLNLQTETSQ